MDAPKIEEALYKDFSWNLHQKIEERRIPIKGQMELTFRCNLKCVHCYAAEDKTKHELSFHEITGILDQIHKEGCLWLSFTGGELLMRSDFIEIYSYAKRKGFLITLLTNGTLMTPDIASFLAEEPPFSIELTLNGIFQETYERISQVPGSFMKVMEAIHLILDKNLPLKIKTKATRLNHHELNKIRQYVESIGLEFSWNAMLFPRLDGSQKPCSYRLSPDEIVSLDKIFQDDESCHEDGLSDEYAIPPDNLYRCAEGRHSFHISPFGELIFCTFTRRPNFSLRNGSFRQGFNTLYPKIRSLKYRGRSRCKDCKIFHVCHQCPSLAKLENGSMEKPVEYFCRLAQMQILQRTEKNDNPNKQIPEVSG